MLLFRPPCGPCPPHAQPFEAEVELGRQYLCLDGTVLLRVLSCVPSSLLGGWEAGGLLYSPVWAAKETKTLEGELTCTGSPRW